MSNSPDDHKHANTIHAADFHTIAVDGDIVGRKTQSQKPVAATIADINALKFCTAELAVPASEM